MTYVLGSVGSGKNAEETNMEFVCVRIESFVLKPSREYYLINVITHLMLPNFRNGPRENYCDNDNPRNRNVWEGVESEAKKETAFLLTR